MIRLYHHPFCPQSRFARLVLSEIGLDAEIIEERSWERRIPFLQMNPAGNIPLLEDGGLTVPGAGGIAEYLDDKLGADLGDRRLMPATLNGRAEMRRLLDWFLIKMHEEVTDYLTTEKIFKRFKTVEAGGGAPEMTAIHAARANIRYHLHYIGYLIATRKWLAGDDLTYADLAAAAHLSTADYLGDVPWEENETAKHWYARVKSRPSFRALMNDRIPGMDPPPHYTDLDF